MIRTAVALLVLLFALPSLAGVPVTTRGGPACETREQYVDFISAVLGRDHRRVDALTASVCFQLRKGLPATVTSHTASGLVELRLTVMHGGSVTVWTALEFVDRLKQ